MPKIYYNEFDPKAAAWLRVLIAEGHIPAGDVDERSILDVKASDLLGHTSCHFFAGIGGWPVALRLAGWPDERPVWTGSCPCQPFSAAGRGLGVADERHLWAAFRDLIEGVNAGRESLGFGRIPAILGEQVASKAGRAWYAGVRGDLEALAYDCGCADLCSACVGEEGGGWFLLAGTEEAEFRLTTLGAPHIRQRLCWVAYAAGVRRDGQRGAEGAPLQGERSERGGALPRPVPDGVVPGRPEGLRGAGGLADSDGGNARAQREQRGGEQRQLAPNGGAGRLADAPSGGLGIDGSPSGSSGHPDQCEQISGVGNAARHDERRHPVPGQYRQGQQAGGPGGDGTVGLEHAQQSGLEGHAGHVHDGGQPGRIGAITPRPVAQAGGLGSWADFDALPCTDGRARRVESGTFPLAHGVPGRVGLLRGYGNAINPVLTAEFILACEEARGGVVT
jgi:DNA (cytosine-5)-methyltransferase 1